MKCCCLTTLLLLGLSTGIAFAQAPTGSVIVRGSAQHSRIIPLGVQHVRNRTVQITSPSHQVIYSIIISQQGGLPAMPSTRNIPLDPKCSSFLLQQLLLQVEQAFLEARNITTTDVIFELDKSS